MKVIQPAQNSITTQQQQITIQKIDNNEKQRIQYCIYFLIGYIIFLAYLIYQAQQKQVLKFQDTLGSFYPKKTPNFSLQVHKQFQKMLRDTNFSVQSYVIAKQYINNGLKQPSQQLLTKQKQYYQTKYRFSLIKDELPLCVVVQAYQAVQNQRYKLPLLSIFRQEYLNYHVIYIDDASKDGTGLYAQNFIKQYAPYPEKFKVIINTFNKNGMRNQYQAGQLCSQDQIFINGPDGDDGLPGTQIFKLYNYYFQKNDAWLVWGQYMSISSGSLGTSKEMDQTAIKQRNVRQTGFLYISHLKAFYNKLWKKVKKEDLKDSRGSFYQAARDLPTVFPLTQMAGQHVKFIPQVTYLYLDFYQQSQFAKKAGNINDVNFQIRKKEKYPLVKCLYENQDGSCIRPSQYILNHKPPQTSKIK